jgi:serine protease Do
VKIQDVTSDIADSVGLKDAKGALVTDVTADGPGAKAGLKSGDIVTKVDGTEIDNALALSRTIAGDQPNQSVQLTVWRDGKETTLTATLGTFSDKTADNTKPTTPPQNDQTPTQSSVGLTLVPNSNGEGLLVQDVDQDSVAADKGFQVGDTILEVDNKKVTTGKDFEDAITAVKNSGRGTALIKAERDGNVRFIGLPLTESKG